MTDPSSGGPLVRRFFWELEKVPFFQYRMQNGSFEK